MTETLYIDANEPPEVQEAVIGEISKRSDIDIEVDIEGLKTGDFLLGDIVFERKEASDLAGSITDGRLREQTARMSADFQHRYLLLEGDPYNLKYSNLHPNSVVGSLVSTNCKKDIDIIPVEDYSSLAYAIYKICKLHLDGDDFDASEYKLKRTEVETEDVQVAMLCQVDEVSKEKAKDIIDKLGGFRRVAKMATDAGADRHIKEDLEEIEGIGEKTSRKIIEAFK